jgi:hypothetical protein
MEERITQQTAYALDWTSECYENDGQIHIRKEEAGDQEQGVWGIDGGSGVCRLP